MHPNVGYTEDFLGTVESRPSLCFDSEERWESSGEKDCVPSFALQHFCSVWMIIVP